MRNVSLLIFFLLLAIPAAAQQSPHGKSIKGDCSECHNASSWQIKKGSIKFDHSTTSFPLTGQHKTVDCRQCHTNLDFSLAENKCLSCHKDVHMNSVSNDCSKCHTTTAWLVNNVNNLHQASRFPLIAIHKAASCNQCHTKFAQLNFETSGINCYDCHKANFATASTTITGHSGFSTDCQQCHKLTANTWVGSAGITHDFFPLIGGHKISTCVSCHQPGTFKGLNKDNCYGCHQAKFVATTNPSHVTLKFDTNCKACHNINSWIPSSFAHTSFALTGAHITAKCQNCHTTGTTGTSTDCYACHSAKYNATTNPNHITGKFPTTCVSCHTTSAWVPAQFDHSKTAFPLIGKHTTVLCQDCHKTGYTGTINTCDGCHHPKYLATTNPNHQTSGFPITCGDCHTPSGWTPATFNHDGPYFPIYSGKHKGKWSVCSECHTNTSNYKSFTCINCHEHSSKTSVDNDHRGVQGYSYSATSCYACHPKGTGEGSFNHQLTNFPLTGAHTTKNCVQCHTSIYAGTPTACYSCHQTNYQITTNVNHQLANFSTDCIQCHTTTAFTPSSFNHATTARYPLTGAHTTKLCKDCHSSTYVNTAKTCDGCHHAKYVATTNPNHQTANFSVDCTTCHNTTAYKPSTFNHATTSFPLTGAHLAKTCNDCHTSATTPKTCDGCHHAKYVTTINPNHQTANLSVQCADCHSTTLWTPSTFNHSTTGFKLEGAHLAKKCNDCHTTAATPKTCDGCHHAKFIGTTNPNHQTSGFPVTCADCHTSTAWTPATFNHDTPYFPIYSGKHKGKWTTCSECHTTSGNYKAFSCIICHEHSNKPSVDSKHNGVQGYIYSSPSCLACHPRGATAGSFNHSTSVFPLTGVHLTTACADCHQSGYTGTSQLCTSCHNAAYTNSTNPSHTAAGISTDCKTCHSASAWVPSTFNHTTTTFPLTNGHANRQCVACHVGTTTGLTNACWQCHAAKFNATTNPNHVTLNLSHACETCHTTVATWKPATFTVHATYWAFQGYHITIQNNCVSCHPNSVWPNTPTTCVGCHLANFNNSTNPPHKNSSRYSTTCTSCHTQNAWTPATFNHSFYPTGTKHASKKCNQCHSAAAYAPQCLSCHQSAFNSKHPANFRKDCWACHGTSKWDDRPVKSPNNRTE